MKRKGKAHQDRKSFITPSPHLCFSLMTMKFGCFRDDGVGQTMNKWQHILAKCVLLFLIQRCGDGVMKDFLPWC